MTASAAKPRRVTKEIANVRALAILRAIADVLEAAHAGRSWRAFELAWFLRRMGEARETLAYASATVRADFAASLADSHRTLQRHDLSGHATNAIVIAARAMLGPLDQLVREMVAGASVEATSAVPKRGPRTTPTKAAKAVPSTMPPTMSARMIAMLREGGLGTAPKNDPLLRKLARAGLANYVGMSVWWLTPEGRSRAAELVRAGAGRAS
ncbi:MAG: hypothetical protein K8H88_33260 [Sandaracinaceae bacterium]|nr:hypothetical protein [Sandaracinaceae bacterium]